MQVKKFEAPTLQEALDHVKRELGPEAIILQTKKYKRGFGLMSKPSVEVTAAVSERSMQKKQYVETRLPQPNRETLTKLPPTSRPISTTSTPIRNGRKPRDTAAASAAMQRRKQKHHRDSLHRHRRRSDSASRSRSARVDRAGRRGRRRRGRSAISARSRVGMSVEEEVRHLKRMIEEMKNAQDEADSEPERRLSALRAAWRLRRFKSAFEQLVINGVDKRYAFELDQARVFRTGRARRTRQQSRDRCSIFSPPKSCATPRSSHPLSGIVQPQSRKRPGRHRSRRPDRSRQDHDRRQDRERSDSQAQPQSRPDQSRQLQSRGFRSARNLRADSERSVPFGGIARRSSGRDRRISRPWISS